MQTGLLAFLALLPILSVALFLVILRWPASRAMPITFVVAVLLALFYWQVPAVRVVGASVKGLIISIELLFIIFGAILLLNTLDESGRVAADTKIVSGCLRRSARAGDHRCVAFRFVH